MSLLKHPSCTKGGSFGWGLLCTGSHHTVPGDRHWLGMLEMDKGDLELLALCYEPAPQKTSALAPSSLVPAPLRGLQ